MGKIFVKFDSTIEQEDIVVQLTDSSEEEAGENYEKNKNEIQQTSIYGIQAPLIKINDTVIDFIDVIEFSMKSTDILPTVSMTVKDRYSLIAMFNTPGCDNILRVQILPQFDNAYKKINLTFYISSVKINNDYIHINGIYKLSKFVSSNIKSFGEINTYKLFSDIAAETGLGFASNIEEDEGDKRYIYCDNKSYLDLLSKEIKYSCKDLNIMNYWIDFWNTLTYVDIYERYNSKDNDEDILIWISENNNEINEGQKVTPVQVPAILTNNPIVKNSQLYVNNYSIVNKGGNQLYDGTDKVYSIYGYDNKEYVDHLIQDGDVKKDIFTKYEYLGEYYGEYNYLLNEKKYNDFLKKISTESVQIELSTPLLAIMRGNKVNLAIYKNDDSIINKQSQLEELGVISNNIETNISLEADEEPKIDDGQFILDKSISDQYMVTACDIKFYNNQWKYIITLNRPAANKPQILNEQ